MPKRLTQTIRHAVLVTLLLLVSFSTQAVANEIVREAIIGLHKVAHFPRFIAEPEMLSPKSAGFSPDGRLLVVNALEAGKTFAFAVGTWEKVWEVRHVFPAAEQAQHQALIPEQFRKFFDFPPTPRAWSGKPVEMAFSPDGRLLYVSSYRKDFDPHGLLASSVSVIETATGTIVASLPTGPIPKSLAVSPDGSRLVIADWGDNTVSVWELGPDGRPAHLLDHFAAGKRLALAGLTGDRDVACGWCLRGVTFSPDGKTALVNRMSRVNGLDLVDAVSGKHLGFKNCVPTSLRHLAAADGKIFVSSPAGKFIASIDYATLVSLPAATSRQAWNIRKTHSTVRTIAVSGGLIVAALHEKQEIAIYDAASLASLGSLPAPAWPVGAGLSPDRQWAVVTAQGYKGSGGHVVAIYKLTP